MNDYKKESPCRHKFGNSCINCNNSKCNFKKIFLDSSVILNWLLLEKNSEKVKDVLYNHRQKYVIYTNQIVVGEIIKRIILDCDYNRLKEIFSENYFLNYLHNSVYIEINTENNKFLNLLKEINKLDIRSKNRDRLIVASILFNNTNLSSNKIELFTFDEKLVEDINNDKFNLDQYDKLKVFKLNK
ncbi:MAG: PIN domain-containing protein [Candidatus ainarchaeum sp.]|nr:PIN domain-containing protein [Candidatus ainarchaeum sp.]